MEYTQHSVLWDEKCRSKTTRPKSRFTWIHHVGPASSAMLDRFKPLSVRFLNLRSGAPPPPPPSSFFLFFPRPTTFALYFPEKEKKSWSQVNEWMNEWHLISIGLVITFALLSPLWPHETTKILKSLVKY